MLKYAKELLIILFFGLTCTSHQEILRKQIKARGKRYAIVVGINNYKDTRIPDLSFAQNDAKRLAEVLRKYGEFDQVFEMTDDLQYQNRLFPDKKNIETQVKRIASLANEEDLFLFSFSGHGISDGKENYMVAIDSDSSQERRFETSIRVQTISDAMKKFKRSLVFVDACREKLGKGMEVSKNLSIPEGLQADIRMYNNSQIKAILFATAKNKLSYEDYQENSQHGVFTRYLVKGLEGSADSDGNGIVSLVELKQYVETEVVSWSWRNHKDQKPFMRLESEATGKLAISLKRRSSWEKFSRLFGSSQKAPVVEKKITKKPPIAKQTGVFTNSLGMKFIRLPKGEFMMGCQVTDTRCEAGEKPLRKVSLDSFYLGMYEVTIAEYLEFVTQTNSHHPKWLEEGNAFNVQTGHKKVYKKFIADYSKPIVGISWFDALAYANWLSKKEGKRYRLPRGEEWEYAARGTSQSKYFWGEVVDGSYAWYKGNATSTTHRVGQKKPNGFGLYDMTGNVWEWTADKYKRYRSRRGCSWGSNATTCRISNRDRLPGKHRGNSVGFRLLLSTPKTKK